MKRDAYTVCYQAIQRSYRNAVVDIIRERLLASFGDSAVLELKKCFTKEWVHMETSANERREQGTGEFGSSITDEFDLLGVNHFFNAFERFFGELFPAEQSKAEKERKQSRDAITGWAKAIKHMRDPLSHPTKEDLKTEDAEHFLYCAKKILDLLNLHGAAAEIQELQRELRAGESEATDLLVYLPPADEVVTDFVGRDTYLDLLRKWLREPSEKRRALSGDGGKGKSAIAYRFAQLAAQDSRDILDAVIWISAKRRRFLQGQIQDVDRADFHDLGTAAGAILKGYGVNPQGLEIVDQIVQVKRFFTDNATLLIVDDIDTLEGEGQKAKEFLVMDLPTCGATKVLLTSRRSLFGLESVTTQVRGFDAMEGRDFIQSRCEWFGLDEFEVGKQIDQILLASDGSPLYIEDILRLTRLRLDLSEAIGLWTRKRGDAAREYALKREYDSLHKKARILLLFLSHAQGPCSFDDLKRATGWPEEDILTGIDELSGMFLLGTAQDEGKRKYILNQNTRLLVIRSFEGSDEYRRAEQLMRAASGKLNIGNATASVVQREIRRASLLMRQLNYKEAERVLRGLQVDYPGFSSTYVALGNFFKRDNRVTDAREQYNRALELNCQDVDLFINWSELECDQEEWSSAKDLAVQGLKYHLNDPDLHFLAGYSLQRRSRELCQTGDNEKGQSYCRQAKTHFLHLLDKARSAGQQGRKDRLARVFRALVLTSEVLEDGESMKNYFAEWFRICPSDATALSELKRLKGKYPQELALIYSRYFDS